MFSFHADDGRILTPPKELKPLLKDAYSVFYILLGHIRFFYVVDEIWNGKDFVVFKTAEDVLASIKLHEASFCITIATETFNVMDESLFNIICVTLTKTASANLRRPLEQLSVDLDEYPSGVRCDMCLCSKAHNENDLSGKEKFAIMDHNCYFGVSEGWGAGEFSPVICQNKEWCYPSTYACLEKKGHKNCLECGEYHTCNSCGVGHEPGQCNLGITADEITSLILPYCEMERLELLKNSK